MGSQSSRCQELGYDQEGDEYGSKRRGSVSMFSEGYSCSSSGGGCVPGCTTVDPRKKPYDLCRGISAPGSFFSDESFEAEIKGVPFLVNDPVVRKEKGWKANPYGPPVYVSFKGFGV